MKGQKLQQEMYRSLDGRKGTWTYRLNDKFNMIWTPKGLRPVGFESPADLLHLASTSLLIECKEEQGKSVAFRRLKSHQLNALLEFEWVNPNHRSYVVIQFTKEKYLCVAIPIKEWLKEEMSADRKSIPIARVKEIGIPLERKKGSRWKVKPLTAPTVSSLFIWKVFFDALSSSSSSLRKIFRTL
jgi:hypothetical protein